MSSGRGKRLSSIAVLVSLAVLCAAAAAGRRRIVEEYHLWKLSRGDKQEKKAAAERLAEMRSTRAIPLLISLEREPYGKASFLYVPPHPFNEALARIGAPAVPHLARALRSQDRLLRDRAAADLRRFQMPEAVPFLREALQDGDPWVRRTAAEMLGQIGPGAADAVTDLIRLLSDAAAEVRIYAAWALADIGVEARAALPELVRVLRTDAADNARRAAARALGKAGAGSPEAAAALREALDDPQQGVRQMAEEALKVTSPSSPTGTGGAPPVPETLPGTPPR